MCKTWSTLEGAWEEVEMIGGAGGSVGIVIVVVEVVRWKGRVKLVSMNISSMRIKEKPLPVRQVRFS